MSDKNGNETGSEYVVGKNKPPIATRFSSENQPEKNGRPKGSISLKTHLRNILDTMLKNEPDPLQEGLARDMTAGEKMMLNLAAKAIADGDIKAIQLALEHLEGKAAQALNIGGQDGDNPLKVDSTMRVELIKAKVSSDE
jgi:hypothetical protein